MILCDPTKGAEPSAPRKAYGIAWACMLSTSHSWSPRCLFLLKPVQAEAEPALHDMHFRIAPFTVSEHGREKNPGNGLAIWKSCFLFMASYSFPSTCNYMQDPRSGKKVTWALLWAGQSFQNPFSTEVWTTTSPLYFLLCQLDQSLCKCTCPFWGHSVSYNIQKFTEFWSQVSHLV